MPSVYALPACKERNWASKETFPSTREANVDIRKARVVFLPPPTSGQGSWLWIWVISVFLCCRTVRVYQVTWWHAWDWREVLSLEPNRTSHCHPHTHHFLPTLSFLEWAPIMLWSSLPSQIPWCPPTACYMKLDPLSQGYQTNFHQGGTSASRLPLKGRM